MPWKSAVGLTLALVVASLALVLILASVQHLLNADEINHRTLKAAANLIVFRR